jgi:transcriptional regulator with XRE-family HTH domain
VGIPAEHESWSARFTRQVAREIQRARKARGWSAQKLSDACAEFGAEFLRSTRADLENGRRAHISVAELVAVARALNVAPLQLITRVGAEEETEILPGEVRDAFRAAQWFAGEAPFPGPDDGDYLDGIRDSWGSAAGGPLEIYRAYDRTRVEELHSLTRARALDERAAAAASAAEREELAVWAAALRRDAEHHRDAGETLRERARSQGILPPC